MPTTVVLPGRKKPDTPKVEEKKINAPRPKPEALISSSYSDLIEHLKERQEVIPFPYDWRISLKESADALKAEVELELKRHDRPIRFIAHSMGGLVVRTMVARHAGTYQQLKGRDCRIVFLGAPSYGSYVIPQLFAGQEKILSLLAMVDLRRGKKGLLEIIGDYPGLLEMLPDEFLDQKVWDFLKKRHQLFFLRLPTGQALKDAKALREIIARAVDKERMLYVAGSAATTPVRISDSGPPVFEGTIFGDGRVTYDQSSAMA